MTQSERLVSPEWRTWWVFYIDPTEPQGSLWRQAGMIGGPFTADEAIARTAGRMFDQPFWAFALDHGEYGAYYDLHYPPGVGPKYSRRERRLGPAGYVAEGRP